MNNHTEIFETLTKLQENLTEINSAKEQVQQTIEAYKGIYPHIDSYAGELGKVSEKILMIIGEVKANINHFDEDSKQVVSNLMRSCQNISSDFSSLCNTNINNINGIADEFKNSANDVLSKLVLELNGFIINFQERINELDKLRSDIVESTKLTSGLKRNIEELGKDLRDSQSEQDKQLDKLILDITTTQKDQDNELAEIKQMLSIIQTNQIKFNEVLISYEEKIKRFSVLQKNNIVLAVFIFLTALITAVGIFMFR